MSDKGEPVRWITVKGARIPVFADGSIGVGTLEKEERKESNNPAWDKAMETITNQYPMVKEVIRIARDGYAFGTTIAGELFVGHGGVDSQYWKDTPENRIKANSYWETTNFSREIKKTKKGAAKKK